MSGLVDIPMLSDATYPVVTVRGHLRATPSRRLLPFNSPDRVPSRT